MSDFTRGDDPIYDSYRGTWAAQQEDERQQRVEELEAENAALREKIEAAIEDIRRIAPCSLCKHNGKQPCENEDSGHEKCFEWRGGQEGEEEL